MEYIHDFHIFCNRCWDLVTYLEMLASIFIKDNFFIIAVKINELYFKLSNTFLHRDRAACIQRLFSKKIVLNFAMLHSRYLLQTSLWLAKIFFKRKTKTTLVRSFGRWKLLQANLLIFFTPPKNYCFALLKSHYEK
jgi:hypothetical protein